MHGVIFLELTRFVDARFGPSAWRGIVREAGLTTTIFLPTQLYPDADLLAIVAAISRKSGKEPGQLLEDFGAFIVPSLATLYAALIEGDWKLLDLLQHTEETIHRVVRIRAPGAAPPRLKCTRLRPDEVEIVYTSERKLCAFAKGIVAGLSKLYEEPATVTESACMLKGAEACRIHVKTSGAKKA